MQPLRVAVAQLGAREHYGVPRILQKHDALARLHTDFWLPLSPLLRPLVKTFGNKTVRRALGRHSSDIPAWKVRTHSLPAARWNLRLRQAKGADEVYAVHREWGRRFAARVAKDIRGLDLTAFLGFSSAALEALRQAKSNGALAILDDIAPVHLEERILAEERKAFPEWEPDGKPICPAYLERIEEERDAADRIIVNSNWARQALLAQNVPDHKIHVVPVSFWLSATAQELKTRHAGNGLRILWLGTLCLRKGIQYAIAAAKLLEGLPVRFTFAGPLEVDLRHVRFPANASYVGQVPRGETARLWACHHVFLIPTLSDGFAITQLEAMAHGLPVLATACCGDVVEHGRSGLIVPPRDPRSLADAILRILDGEFDLEFASDCALQRARVFSPEAVWRQLCPALTPDP